MAIHEFSLIEIVLTKQSTTLGELSTIEELQLGRAQIRGRVGKGEREIATTRRIELSHNQRCSEGKDR